MASRCGFTWDGVTCEEVDPHRCTPRGDKVVDFFEQVLVHPKGVLQGKPFVLEDWQEDEIIRPIFESVHYDAFSREYVRVIQIAWIELARKSGKSTLVAGIVLYMLTADGEMGGENYIGARDRNQASVIFNTCEQMVQLSADLNKQIKILTGTKRLVHEKSRSFLQVISSDAMSALGFNPHGTALDEVVAHPNSLLWDSMRTAMGARKQPLLIAATTAGTDANTFAGQMHKEMDKVQEDPARAEHTFVYMRNTPMKADPFDEANWYHANPGLGSYLSLEALRHEAREAQNDPSREISFRTYRLNQWTQVASRWMPMHVYDASQGGRWDAPDVGREALRGQSAFAGLDLASTNDLSSWCLAVAPAVESEPVHLLWRFWLPEDAVKALDEKTDGLVGRWVDAGWIRTNEGNVVDYEQIYADITEDLTAFNVVEIDYDAWSAQPAVQAIEALSGKSTQFVKIQQHFAQMSPNMTALMTAVQGQKVAHHHNPVARWCFDNVEVRFDRQNPDNVLPVKPQRNKDAKRIDAVVSAAMAVGAYTLRGQEALKPKGPKGRTRGKRAFAF